MLQIRTVRENLIAGIAQKYFNHVILVFPQELDPQQFFFDYCQVHPEFQQDYNNGDTSNNNNEYLLTQLHTARQNFLNSVDTLNFPVFYCNYCNRRMIPAEVANHVRSVGHVTAKDESDNIPSFGCPIVLHGRPMLLDHHVIFPHSMFGNGVMIYDDSVGAVVLPDASQAVTLCPGHEYSLIRFQLSTTATTTTTRKNSLPKKITFPCETRQNRYFTKDFVEGSKKGGPKDDSTTKFRKTEHLAKNVLELDVGEDFPDSINAAATAKVGRIRKQMELLKIQDVRNRAGKKRDDRDETVLRFPKNAAGSVVNRVAGVTALCSVDEQVQFERAKVDAIRERLVRKWAKEAVMNNDNKSSSSENVGMKNKKNRTKKNKGKKKL